MFFVQASNVHQGGGKTLLLAAHDAVPHHIRACILSDTRMVFSPRSDIEVVRIPARARLLAEWRLARRVQVGDAVLCFGNLPPLFKLAGYTAVFIQNRYLVDDVTLDHFDFRIRLRLILERFWLSWTWRHADEFIVQTPTMKRLLQKKLGEAIPIAVMPFMPDPPSSSQPTERVSAGAHYDFVYVASGEPHKNHRRLIESWIALAQEGLYPTLALTISPEAWPQLCRWIEAQKMTFNLHIENLGVLPKEQVLELYGRSGALIYPSTFESLGLPLVEAQRVALPIVAAELDYVRDLLDPAQTFDPTSVQSIARAVKRFMKNPSQAEAMKSAGEFMAYMVAKQKTI